MLFPVPVPIMNTLHTTSGAIARILRSGGWRGALLLGTLSALIALLVLARTNIMTAEHPDFPKAWDHHKYIRMAEGNPFDFHIAPFCRRVLEPAIVRLLPFPAACSFLAIAVACSIVTPVLLFFILRRLGFSPIFSFIGFLAFHSFGYATKFVYFDFWLPDAPSFFFIALLIFLLLSRRDRAFLLLFAAGVLVKESVLFVLPLAYTLRARKIADGNALRRAAVLALPALIAFALLRLLIPALNDDPAYVGALPETLRTVQHHSAAYDYPELMREIGEDRLRHASLRGAAFAAIGSFGLYALLFPFAGARRNGELFLRFLPLLLLAPLQLLFAVNIERLLTVAFPALIPLIAGGMQRTGEKLLLPPAAFITFPALLILFNLIDPNGFTPTIKLHLAAFLLPSFFIGILFLLRAFRGARDGARRDGAS